MRTQPLFEPFVDNTYLTLSANRQGKPFFETEMSFTASANGDLTGLGHWYLDKGILSFTGQSEKAVCEFDGLETRNGAVYAVGRFVKWAGRQENIRAVLHENKCVKDSFAVCVSSNKSYADKTLPVLLESLCNAKVPKDRVFVIVNGTSSESEVMGFRCFPSKDESKLGLCALHSLCPVAEHNYWLLLHDTCEATIDFVDEVGKVDVGLNPDIVLVRSGLEIGLYSSDFLLSHGKMVLDTNQPYATAWNQLLKMARTVVLRKNKSTFIGERDIYGNGVRRKIESLGMGIVKFTKVYNVKGA